MPVWEDEPDAVVITDSKQQLKKPPLYKVLLHNDDYTTMDFVVLILKNVFHKSGTDAYRIMMALPGQFDPLLLRHFIQGNGIYPVGSRVKLGTGEIARVRRQTGDVEKPVVEVEVSSAGTALRSGRRPERDLSRGDGTELYLVRQLLLDDDAA